MREARLGLSLDGSVVLARVIGLGRGKTEPVVKEVRLEELRLGGFVGLAGDLIRLGRRTCNPITLHLMFPSPRKTYLYVAIDDRGIEHTDVGKLTRVYDMRRNIVNNPYSYERLVKDAVMAEVYEFIDKGWTITNYKPFVDSLRTSVG